MITVTPYSSIKIDNSTRADTLYISDHMPPVSDIRIDIDGQKHYFKNTVIEALHNASLSTEFKTTISDHYLYFEDFDNFTIDVEQNFFIRSAKEFSKLDYSLDLSNSITRKFCFLSNKARQHRLMCGSVIANLFDYNDIAYSFNYFHIAPLIVNELLIDTDYKFNPELMLPERWIQTNNNQIKSDDKVEQYNQYHKNSLNFMDLHAEFFKHTAVSVITEPSFYERGGIATEKTLQAIYAGHFMIWPGAYKLPSKLEKLGIDVFNGTIDHSYQYIEHPGKRIIEAFLRNKHLLDNIDLQTIERRRHSAQLISNYELVKDIPYLLKQFENLNSDE